MPTQSQSIAIIGYGTAGVNALIGLRNAGYAGKVQVFSNTGIRPYSPILTSYYAWGEKSYDECFPWSDDELASLDAEVISGTPVAELDVEAHMIRTKNASYPYSKCIIATGSTPSCNGFPKTQGYEPLTLRTMDDAQRLRDALEDPACKKVLVSGASMVALKTVEACLNQGADVTLVGISSHVLDFNALPQAAARFEKGLEGKGVSLRLAQTIRCVEVIENPSRHLGRELKVTFSNGDVESFDEISVAHGMKSNLEFVSEGMLEMDKALIVDGFMRTSDPDVYAAGDVVQALELISGEKRVVGIWKNAAVQGACAGNTAAVELAGGSLDESMAYGGSISTNTIAVGTTLFISAGTIELSEGRWTEILENDEMTDIRIYENAPDGSVRIVGFNIVCDSAKEGDVAYDTAAMLTLRIEKAFRR